MWGSKEKEKGEGEEEEEKEKEEKGKCGRSLSYFINLCIWETM